MCRRPARSRDDRLEDRFARRRARAGPCSAGASAGSLRRGARDDALARGAAVGRGLRAAVDARCEPGQVASRAHDLVLRDVRPPALPARIPAVRPRVPRALQLVLQRDRRAASASPSAACCRGRPSTRSSPIARTSTRAWPRCSRVAGADAELAQILELGLQHEQQHQELILTDVKHLLSRNPLAPAYRRARPLPPHAAAAAPLDRARRGTDRGRRRRVGVRVRQRIAAPSRVHRAVRARVASRSPTANISRSSTTAATGGPSSGWRWAGTSSRRRSGRRRSTGTGATGAARHSRSPAASRSRRTLRSCT